MRKANNLTTEWFVNVRDAARIHVAALLSESVRNERVFASAARYTWNEVLAILRRRYPSKTFADDLEGVELSNLVFPGGRGLQLLRDVFGREGWTGLEETIVENVKDLAYRVNGIQDGLVTDW